MDNSNNFKIEKIVIKCENDFLAKRLIDFAEFSKLTYERENLQITVFNVSIKIMNILAKMLKSYTTNYLQL